MILYWMETQMQTYITPLVPPERWINDLIQLFLSDFERVCTDLVGLLVKH